MCANIFELSNIVNILHLTNINRFDQNSFEGIYNLILILATLKRVLLAVIRFIKILIEFRGVRLLSPKEKSSSKTPALKVPVPKT